MAQMKADDVMKSGTGKSLRVKIGAQWFGADLDSGLQKGSVFSAEVQTGKFGPWLTEVDLGASIPPVEAPRGSSVGGSSGGIPTFPTVAPFWMPFASNVVAHAISGGLVKTPTDIKAWVLAAKEAAEKAAIGDASF